MTTLSPADRAACDNAAAGGSCSSLGAPPAAAEKATAQLRLAGDQRRTVESRRLRAGFSAFGQTGWRLSDQARSWRGCVGVRLRASSCG